MTSSVPSYPPSRNLLKDKSVVITAAAGTGIGFATAKRVQRKAQGLCFPTGTTVGLKKL